MDSLEKEKAMDIIISEISKLMEKLMNSKSEDDTKLIEEKIDVLEKIKMEIYKGNKKIINKVLKVGVI